MDYKEDAVLDTDNFDEEIERHGQRYMEYVERSAEAEFDKSVAKQRTVIVRAEIARKIRRNPKKYGLDGFPPTVVEKMLKDTVERNKEVKRAFKNFKGKNIIILTKSTKKTKEAWNKLLLFIEEQREVKYIPYADIREFKSILLGKIMHKVKEIHKRKGIPFMGEAI